MPAGFYEQTQSLHKSLCRSGLLAAIAPEDSAPTGPDMNLIFGEFLNQYTKVYFIL